MFLSFQENYGKSMILWQTLIGLWWACPPLGYLREFIHIAEGLFFCVLPGGARKPCCFNVDLQREEYCLNKFRHILEHPAQCSNAPMIASSHAHASGLACTRTANASRIIMHTRNYTHTHTHKQIRTHACTQTHKHTSTQTHKHTDTKSQNCQCYGTFLAILWLRLIGLPCCLFQTTTHNPPNPSKQCQFI
jgi:hypothetical protein